MKPRYKAVIETGWHSRDGEYWEERRDCGHLHRSVEAAEACGAKRYASRYENGSWTANAAWHGYCVHDAAGPAGDDSPWPVDAVAVDPAAIAHDTELLAEQAREPRSRHASAASAVGAMPRR